MFSKVSTSQRKTALAQMQMLATSLDTYRLDLGDYPPNLAELRQSTRTGWDGPYLPRDIPLDPWGHPYQFQVPGENGQPYTLRSFGKDGSPGGEGDGADIVFQ
jgi:general secretion pathway protein G